jgi:hypothetical protein
VTGPIRVYVDWAKNGNFTNTWDEVTEFVRGGITLSYGREAVTTLSPAIAGRGSFSLDNTTKRYSPRNASSPLFGSLKPYRPVLITRDVKVGTVTTTFTLFRGHTDDAPISPDLDSKIVTLNLVDYLGDFDRNTITTTLYQGLRSGDAIGKILDAAGWTGGRDIDPGSSVFPWWWAEGESALDAMQRVLASEGSPALLTVGSSGEIVFRDRNHRLVRSASTTVQARIQGKTVGAEPVMGRPFTYSDNWQNIVNDVLLQVDERRPQAVQVVFSTDEFVFVPSSSSATLFVKTSDPFFNAVTPVEDTDYTVSAGSVTSVTLTQTSGAATQITYTAPAGGATVGDVQLRGQPVPVVRSYQVTATDSTSQTDYGQRDLPAGVTPEWASRYDVTDVSAQAVAQRKNPLPLVTVTFTCHHTQVARLNAVLSLDLSDRVTITEPETALANDFFVESISHEIADLTSHVITLGLEMVPSTPTGVFILNTSTLNGADPLGY